MLRSELALKLDSSIPGYHSIFNRQLISDLQIIMEMTNYSKNLKFRSYSFGIGCKFNLVNYSKSSVIPYFNLNSGYRLSTISSDETLYPVTLENNDGETKYSFVLKIPSNSELFFNPYVEVGIGVETKLKNKVYFLLEGNLIFVNYPTIDIPNPTLSKEFYISIGFRYKFLKNKRYYYD
jgi:hypothetical protein